MPRYVMIETAKKQRMYEPFVTDNRNLEQPNNDQVISTRAARVLQFDKPRMLTQSEIEALRQDKVQAHNQARKILAKMKVPSL